MSDQADAGAASNAGTVDAAIRARDARRSARRELQQRTAERLAPGRTTSQLLARAAHGTDEQPVADHHRDQILIDSPTWAVWIVAAAQAFAICPGFEILEQRPLPDVGAGIEAGKHVFQLAREASVEQVAAAIDNLRARLGRPTDELAAADTESETGLLAYFRQLDRFWDGVAWSPPLPAPPTAPAQAQAIDSSRSSTPATAQPAKAQGGLLNYQEIAASLGKTPGQVRSLIRRRRSPSLRPQGRAGHRGTLYDLEEARQMFDARQPRSAMNSATNSAKP
jgi:hypothetical protein